MLGYKDNEEPGKHVKEHSKPPVTCPREMEFQELPDREFNIIVLERLRDFPGGPVVKTPCFHFRGHGFDPWSGN